MMWTCPFFYRHLCFLQQLCFTEWQTCTYSFWGKGIHERMIWMVHMYSLTQQKITVIVWVDKRGWESPIWRVCRLLFEEGKNHDTSETWNWEWASRSAQNALSILCWPFQVWLGQIWSHSWPTCTRPPKNLFIIFCWMIRCPRKAEPNLVLASWRVSNTDFIFISDAVETFYPNEGQHFARKESVFFPLTFCLCAAVFDFCPRSWSLKKRSG